MDGARHLMDSGTRDRASTSGGPPLAATSDFGSRLAITALVAAALISNVGNYLAAVAIPWFVLVTTGSTLQTGIAGIARVLPTVLSGVLGGVIADRLGYRRTSILSDLASGLSIVLLPALYLLGILAYWHLLLLVFLGSLLDSPGRLARRAMVPALVRSSGISLERANSALQLADYGAEVAGSLAAGVLIGTIGAPMVLAINGATFAFSAFIVGSVVRIPSLSPKIAPELIAPRITAHLQELLAEVTAGFRVIAADQLLVTMSVISIWGNFLFAPLITVILPVYTRERFGSPTALGFLIAAVAAGSITGTVLYGIIGARVPRRHIFVGCLSAGASALWLLAVSQRLVVGLATAFCFGLVVGPLNVLGMVIFQERAPEQVLGRALGAAVALAQGAAPVGLLVFGLILESLSLSAVMIAVAAGFSILAGWMALGPVSAALGAPKSH